MNIAVGVLFVPLYLYFLGVEGYGVYSLVIMLFGWLTLLQAGVEPAVTKLIAQYHAENKINKINSLVTLGFIVQFILAGLIGVLIYLNIDYLARFFVKDEIDLLEDTKIALALGAINIVALMCRNVYVAFLKGMQRYDISSVFESVFGITASVLALVFLWMGYGITGIVLGRLILNLLSLFILRGLSRKILSSLHFTTEISKEIFIEIMHYGSWVVVGRLNRLAVNALPPILITQYLGPAGVAYYKIATTVVMAINNLLSSAINVVFPQVSHLKALDKTEEIKSLYSKANAILSYISAPMYFFCFIFSWQIIYIWLGVDMADNLFQLIPIFFIGYYLSSASMVPSIFSLGLGNAKLLAYAGTVQTLVVLLTLPTLLKQFDIVGAGYNLILFELVSVVSSGIITAKYIKSSIIRYWINERLMHLLVIGLIYSSMFLMLDFLGLLNLDRVYTGLVLIFTFTVGLVLYVFLSIKFKLDGYETILKLADRFLWKSRSKID